MQLGDDESIRATCDLDIYLYIQWSMLQWGKPGFIADSGKPVTTQ